MAYQQGYPQQGQPQYFAPPPGQPPQMQQQQQQPQQPQQYQQQQGHPQQQQQYFAPPPGQPPQMQQHQPQHQQHQQHQQLQQQQQPQRAFAPTPPAPAPAAAAAGPTDQGQFRGGTYSISHRDTNAILTVTLQPGATVRSKPGAMVHMSSSVSLAGNIKFSMKKLLTGGSLAESTYTGPGNVALGPTLFGDIITVHVDGRQPWTIGRDAFLACTPEITKETKAQGLGKALFSGEDLFVVRIGGQGILWLTSFGAVDRLDLQPGQTHIVDNGHLVAWSCDYRIEKAGGGSMTGMKTGEGLVCRFTGPGSVYVQTRNMDEFQNFIRALVPGGGGGGGGSLLGLIT